MNTFLNLVGWFFLLAPSLSDSKKGADQSIFFAMACFALAKLFHIADLLEKGLK